VALELSFLAALGLVPILVVGLYAPADAAEQARSLARKLDAVGVGAAIVADEAAIETARRGTLPIIALDGKVERLGALVSTLATRKLIFVTRAGGFRVRGASVPIVNLTTETETLAESKDLSRKQHLVLADARRLVLELVPHKLTVSVTAPLDLLRELFTVKGAGTLLRRGAAITRRGLGDVDPARLAALLASSFGRPVRPEFFDTPSAEVYLEEGYRGTAVLVETDLGAYLSKFAVEREAQGEGLGRDLWDAVRAEHPTLFWRARPTNAIGAWYAQIADGLMRFSEWTVFWKGLASERVPAAIAFALAQPADFA
jgi:acetylglutamate synthase